MTALSVTYVVLFYLAMAIFIVGITSKIMQYIRVPAPLKVPVTPAPISRSGVVWRFFTEIVFFNSLFRATKWTWIFGWIFHLALLLAFLRHLRYVISPESFLWPVVNLQVVQSFGHYAGYAMLFGLVGLLGRRFFVDRVRYISSPSDYLMLVLLIAIAGTGMWIHYFAHTDIVQLKAFILGLFYLNWQNLPADPLLLIHLSLVLLLMVIFPMSKLLHAPGLFFSPSRYQIDNPREQRHLSPWAAEIEARDGKNA